MRAPMRSINENGSSGSASYCRPVRAALPWLMILLLFLVMVTYIPQISLFLPELVFD